MVDILHAAETVLLRRLTPEDREEFIGLVKDSVDFLHPWAFLPVTSAKFDDYIGSFDGKTAERLLICLGETGAIVGAVSICDIIRSSYDRATVGYNSFANSAGRGYMTEGFSLVFRFAFGELGLHRLEADIQPANEASLRLARRVGFRREGYSPAFARIGGVWRDHERWAITSEAAADVEPAHRGTCLCGS